MVASISGASPLSSTPIPPATQNKGAGKAQGVQDQSSEQITNQVTTTNADGSTTTVITYADGTTSTTTQQAASSAAQSAKTGQQAQAGQAPGGAGTTGGLLDTTNLGQNAALLSAQERARG